jgi:hypothetical protein
MPYQPGDQPSTWTFLGKEIPYRPGGITEEEHQQWLAANSCPCIDAGRPCDGSCIAA